MVPIWNTCLTCLSAIISILLSRTNLSLLSKVYPFYYYPYLSVGLWVMCIYDWSIFICWSNIIRKLLSKVRGRCYYYIESNLCLFDHNTWTPWPFLPQILIWELGKTTGMLLTRLSDSKLSGKIAKIVINDHARVNGLWTCLNTLYRTHNSVHSSIFCPIIVFSNLNGCKPCN